MDTFTKLAIVFAVIVLSKITCFGQTKIDVSAIDVFWKVAEKLSLDQKPSEQHWKLFSDHPAYQQIQNQGNRVSFLKKVLPVVFMPSNKKKLDDLLKGKDSFIKELAKHFVNVKSSRSEITSFIETLDLNKILTYAPQRSLAYLPKDIVL